MKNVEGERRVREGSHCKLRCKNVEPGIARLGNQTRSLWTPE